MLTFHVCDYCECFALCLKCHRTKIHDHRTFTVRNLNPNFAIDDTVYIHQYHNPPIARKSHIWSNDWPPLFGCQYTTEELFPQDNSGPKYVGSLLEENAGKWPMKDEFISFSLTWAEHWRNHVVIGVEDEFEPEWVREGHADKPQLMRQFIH